MPRNFDETPQVLRLLFRAPQILLLLLVGCTGDAGEPGEDGSNGATALTETTPEPPGENCANGGIKIEVGIDANGNGALDADEVIAVHPARRRGAQFLVLNGFHHASGHPNIQLIKLRK